MCVCNTYYNEWKDKVLCLSVFHECSLKEAIGCKCNRLEENMDVQSVSYIDEVDATSKHPSKSNNKQTATAVTELLEIVL